MAFSWTTFGLEAVNFLVLVWILHWLLYRPVMAAIGQRQAAIQGAVDAARQDRMAAEALKAQYDQRVASLAQAGALARADLEAEIAAERARRLQTLEAMLESERVATRALDAQRLSTAERQARAQGYGEAARFAARLLGRLSGPELQGRIVAAVLEDLEALPEWRRQAIRRSCTPDDEAVVSAAFELEAAQRATLERALSELADRPIACAHLRDPRLIAGIRIELGAYMLEASVADGLKYFVPEAERAG